MVLSCGRSGESLRWNARIESVRHRSRATSSRQPRQVRKEATVTGSYVCSGPPVPGLAARFPVTLAALAIAPFRARGAQ